MTLKYFSHVAVYLPSMQWNSILYSAHLFLCLKELGFYIYSFHPLLINKEMIQFKKYLASAYYVPWTLLELGGLQQKWKAKTTSASRLIKEGDCIKQSLCQRQLRYPRERPGETPK